MRTAQISVWLRRLAVTFIAALSLAHAQVEGPNGHYYQVVIAPGLSWVEARSAAEQSNFNGVHGHLATITSPEEDQFIEQLRIEAAPGGYNSLWVGGSQLSSATGPYDGWFWVNGEGAIPTGVGDPRYSNWHAGEPNDYSGPASEMYLSVGHFNQFGWNDEPNGRHVYGYVVEYPSGGRAAVVKVVATDPSANEFTSQSQTPSPAPVETARFTFSRTGNLALDLPVYFSIHGTAVNGADYNEITKTIIIPAGQSEVNLEIVPRKDSLTVVEPMETVGIRIEPSLINTPSAAYEIDVEHREAVAVIFETPSQKEPSVDIGMPRNGFNYKLGEAVVVIAAVEHCCASVSKVEFFANDLVIGTLNKTDDLLGLEFFRFAWTSAPEGSHTLRVRITMTTGAQITSRAANITVTASDPPTVAIRYMQPDTTEPIPFADYAPGFLEVRRIGPTTHDLSVFYSIGGTATADVDYEALQGYVVIPAGRAVARIVVAAKDDPIDEPNETVIVTLVPPPAEPVPPMDSAPTYNIDPEHKIAEVVIYDNDEPEPSLTVSIVATRDHTIENGTDAFGKFTITRTGPAAETLNVVLQYSGTATAGADYNRLPENVIIPAGVSSYELHVKPIDDQIIEGDETVIATLAPVRGVPYNVDQTRSTATVVINDNDAPTGPTIVRIDAIDKSATEAQPDGGPAADNATLRVSRTGNFSNDLLVFYSIHGTAKNGVDYQELPSSITIPAGENSADIVIIPRSDTPSIGHKYEVVQEGGLTWAQAREKARQKTYLNLFGHLATITSAEEDAKIEALRQEAGAMTLWVGGFQEPSETSITEGWKWVNNEGPIPGVNGGDVYANWMGGEPNDYWGPASENGMVIGWLNTFGWNDQGLNVGANGYVVEFDVNESAPNTREIMETIGIRLEPSTALAPIPSYEIDASHRSSAAVIFDGQPPTDGAVEIAIPISGAIYQGNDVEFLAVAQHPMTQIASLDFYINDVKVGTSQVETPPSVGGGIVLHWFKWSTPVNGEHVLQAKATLGGGRVLQSSRIPFTVQGVISDEPPRITIQAADAEATEFPPNADGFNPARFLIERTGSTTRDLQVFFSIHGTAKNGEDYERIASPITIPAGQSSATLEIMPLSDRVAATHKYEIVAEQLSWDQARAKAEAATFEGVKGHLATITSAEEDQLIDSLRLASGIPTLWVGGYQEPGEPSITGGWKWVNNEGFIPGNNEQPGYANWLQGEPNDYWGPSSENYMTIGWAGSFGWNDQGSNMPAHGYVVEFDLNATTPAADELMETVGIRLEPSPAASPLPTYTIDDYYHSAAAVIFDGAAPANGAIEVAIPSSGEVYNSDRVDFWVAAYHPTMDVQVVKFFVDDVEVGLSRVERSQPTQGGVIQHRLVWDSPRSGQHTLQAKSTLNNGQTLVSSRIPFTVQRGDNSAPVAILHNPADGSVYIDGDSLTISGSALDADGIITKIEILLDGFAIASRASSSIEHRISPDVGPHTIQIRATDDDGATATSQIANILVRDRHEVAFVHRELPETYSPGVALPVVLRANPPEGTFAYAVEDEVPAGWLVSGVSHDGAFDRANSKVKYGPFTDANSRSLTYWIMPPMTARGQASFSGNGSVNGAIYPITGDSTIEQLVPQYHPADSNQDFRITLSEVTAYSAAWKAGRSWSTGPSPIPVSYVTRAHHIWQRGEVYRFDASAGAAPACWVPTSAGSGGSFTIAAIGSAQRSVSGDMRSGAATQIQITAAPAAGATSYAVEERPPHGWTISNVSHDGVYDSATGVIRWGVFADATTRAFTYTATPPAAVSSIGIFGGQLSYDGKLTVITADSRLENSVSIDGPAPIRLTCERIATGIKLNITGPAGQTGVIEASSDFTSWTEVKSIFIPDGAVEVTDAAPTDDRRFYRLRVQ